MADRKQLIEELFKVRDEIDRLEKLHIKDLKARKKELENALLAELEVGEKAAFQGIGTVSVKEEIVPHVTDWDAVFTYVRENNAFHLLAKRFLAAPFREHLQAVESGLEDKPIDGVEPTVVRKLNVQKAA